MRPGRRGIGGRAGWRGEAASGGIEPPLGGALPAAVPAAAGAAPGPADGDPGLPRALRPFLAFLQALRAEGFEVAPEQSQAFIAAVGLLGPRDLRDVRRAARATLGPPPDRAGDFDRIFDATFLGRAFAAPAPGAPDALRAFDAGAAGPDLMEAGDEEPSGARAAVAERLFARGLAAGEDALAAFRRALPAALPRRRARRRRAGKGPQIDAARAFRQMARRDGELFRLPRLRRRTRQRPVLLLIDISGSMKAGTDDALRLAHALVQGGDRVEVFTLGTRLTRVTRALAPRDPGRALAQVSASVVDWDGGTRLGEALQAFLSVPRFAATARGALVVVLSDGLERGGPEALVAAVARLRGRAWRILWLTPLAADPAFRPETGALRAVLPMIDRLASGAGAEAVATAILRFSRDPDRLDLGGAAA